MHSSDDAIIIVTTGNFNHRLFSEMICHKDLHRRMLDAKIYTDCIANIRITNMDAIMKAVPAHEQSDQPAWKREILVSVDVPESLKMYKGANATFHSFATGFFNFLGESCNLFPAVVVYISE